MIFNHAKIVKVERNAKNSLLIFFIAEAHPILLKDSESRAVPCASLAYQNLLEYLVVDAACGTKVLLDVVAGGFAACSEELWVGCEAVGKLVEVVVASY